MHMTRRAFVAWLAVFALFVQVLAPLSSALAFDAGTDGEFRVICTATGVKTVALGQNGEPATPEQGISCPFCLIHAPAALVPPVAALGDHIQLTKPDFALPHAQRQANLWRAHPNLPRGPPLTA
jgi:hypothetical protein